jgi:hypothetical protein
MLTLDPTTTYQQMLPASYRAFAHVIRTLAVRPMVFREGATWDRLYQTLVDYWPDLLSYETRSSYAFPVVRLDPVA